MQLNTRKKNMKLTVRENRLLRDTADLLQVINGAARMCGHGKLEAKAHSAHEDLMVIIGDLLKLEEDLPLLPK